MQPAAAANAQGSAPQLLSLLHTAHHVLASTGKLQFPCVISKPTIYIIACRLSAGGSGFLETCCCQYRQNAVPLRDQQADNIYDCSAGSALVEVVFLRHVVASTGKMWFLA